MRTVEGVALRITSPAKTVADCFKFRNKVGLDVALDALRDVLRERKATTDDLWRCAKVNRVANVMRHTGSRDQPWRSNTPAAANARWKAAGLRGGSVLTRRRCSLGSVREAPNQARKLSASAPVMACSRVVRT